MMADMMGDTTQDRNIGTCSQDEPPWAQTIVETFLTIKNDLQSWKEWHDGGFPVLLYRDLP